MPGNRGILLSALAVAAFGLAVAGCGDDTEGTIPESAGGHLLAQLAQVQEQVEAGDCDAAQATAVAFAESVSQLPEDVDPEVRDALVEAAVNLEGLSERQCTPASGATGEVDALPEPPAPAPDETTTPETEAPEDAEGDDEGGGPPGKPGKPDKPDKGNGNGPPGNGPPPQEDEDDGDDGDDGDTGGIGGES